MKITVILTYRFEGVWTILKMCFEGIGRVGILIDLRIYNLCFSEKSNVFLRL
jgi:hypothetical protein